MNAAARGAGGRGSWPWLLGAAALFLAGFAAIRQSSPFLRIEARATRAAELARTHGVDRAAVLALHEGRGVDLDDAAWARLVADYATEQARLGRELAALWVLGDEAARAAVTKAVQASGREAWSRLATSPLALPAHRFVAAAERFAARSSTRD